MEMEPPPGVEFETLPPPPSGVELGTSTSPPPGVVTVMATFSSGSLTTDLAALALNESSAPGGKRGLLMLRRSSVVGFWIGTLVFEGGGRFIIAPLDFWISRFLL